MAKSEIAALTQLLAKLVAKELKSVPAPQVREKKRKQWTKVKKRCPVCNKVKPVLSIPKPGEKRGDDFGLRPNRDGGKGPQSWCRACRNTANYYRTERKYKQA